MTAAIQLQGVSKKFILHRERPRSLQEMFLNLLRLRGNGRREEFWALRDISFTVEQGEMVGLIGPNGSGKSTLLKLIARILEPTTGQITVNGRVSALLELGAGFHPELTGRENVFLNGSILGLSRQDMECRFEEILEFAGLGRFIDIPVKHYSSGMLVRLGFAIATSVDPDVLLIDEVLAVGDSQFQKRCLDRIAELRRQRTSILFVSHDLEAVGRFCDWVMRFDQGRIVDRGAAKPVINRYLLAVAKEAEKARLNKQGEREEQSRSRTGNREVEITQVTLYGVNGQPRTLFESGEPFTVEINYQVHQAVDDVCFGIGLYRNDGLYCYGTNTLIDDVEVDIGGPGERGTVRVIFDWLGLLPGTYSLDVAVHARDGYPYDYYRGYCTFTTYSIIRDDGVYRPPHRWEVIRGEGKRDE